MTFGLQVFGANGANLFDSRTKRYFTLVGKMVSKRDPYEYQEYRIKIPSKYTPNNSIVVFKLEAWKGIRGNWFFSIDGRGREVKFNWFGTKNVADPPIPYPELYLYSSLPVTAGSSYGLNVWDSAGSLSFHAGRSSDTLKIIEQVNTKPYGSPLTEGSLLGSGGANGVIVNAAPIQASPIGGSMYKMDYTTFRLDNNGRIRCSTGFGEAYGLPGGYSFNYFSVATVKLPTWSVPIIPW